MRCGLALFGGWVDCELAALLLVEVFGGSRLDVEDQRGPRGTAIANRGRYQAEDTYLTLPYCTNPFVSLALNRTPLSQFIQQTWQVSAEWKQRYSMSLFRVLWSRLAVGYQVYNSLSQLSFLGVGTKSTNGWFNCDTRLLTDAGTVSSCAFRAASPLVPNALGSAISYFPPF